MAPKQRFIVTKALILRSYKKSSFFFFFSQRGKVRIIMAMKNPHIIYSLLSQFMKSRRRQRLIMSDNSDLFAILLKRKKRNKLMKAQMLLIMSLMTIPDPRNSVCRSVRRNARNTGWWCRNTFSVKRFKETFRVARATFLTSV